MGSGIGVERTDFASVITQDKEQALAFYGETLGLRRNPERPRGLARVCRQAWFRDPDGNALMLHRRFDAQP